MCHLPNILRSAALTDCVETFNLALGGRSDTPLSANPRAAQHRRERA